MGRQRRRLALLGGAALGVVLIGAVGAGLWLSFKPLPEIGPAPRQPIEPNLATALSELIVGEGDGGTQRLFFTTTIGNVGDGALVLRADRRHRWSADWRVTQIFDEADGPPTAAATPGRLVWGGHGHDHWHLRFGYAQKLVSLDRRRQRVLAKAGYCFFDQQALTAPKTDFKFSKDTCDGSDRTSLQMGMSSGWSDPYQWTLPDQSLDVTGFPDGTYRLTATADPDGWIRESDERDNMAWKEIELTTSTSPPRVRVLRSSPPLAPE